MPDRECVICGRLFTPRRVTGKTCSLDCQIRHRRNLSRESVARRYKPRPQRPDTECEACGTVVPAPKSGPMPRWCSTCRASNEDARARARVAVRRCYKCQAPVPEAARKAGKATCSSCRVDKRDRGREYEQRRRLRKYGLTQDEYDELLHSQGNRCAGCGTDAPGAKGWCIDHCHSSGKVRAILCNPCNTMLGLAKENPEVLRSLANIAERFMKVEEIKI